MNIQVATSEGSDVGTAQNILGNIGSCTYANYYYGNPIHNAQTIGSISDEKNDTLYWLVAGENYSLNDYVAIITDPVYVETFFDDLGISDGIVSKDLIMRKTLSDCEPVFVDIHNVLLEIPEGFQNQATSLASFMHDQIEDGGGTVVNEFAIKGVLGVDAGMFVTGIAEDGSLSNTVVVEEVIMHNDTIPGGHTNIYFNDILNLTTPQLSHVLVTAQIEGNHCDCAGDYYIPTGRIITNPNTLPYIGDAVEGPYLTVSSTVTDVGVVPGR